MYAAKEVQDYLDEMRAQVCSRCVERQRGEAASAPLASRMGSDCCPCPMKLDLIVRTAGKWQGKHITVNHVPFLIGRDPACNLRPTTSLVSNRHCALIGRAGKLYVRDMGSTNGTFLNSRKITAQTELHQNDRLRVGPVDFEVVVEGNPSPSERTPLPPNLTARALEEEAAALLLSVQDSASPATSTHATDIDGVPTGRTTTDARLPELAGTADAGQARPATAQAVQSLDTPAAAADLLQRYLRRAQKKWSEPAYG